MLLIYRILYKCNVTDCMYSCKPRHSAKVLSTRVGNSLVVMIRDLWRHRHIIREKHGIQ